MRLSEFIKKLQELQQETTEDPLVALNDWVESWENPIPLDADRVNLVECGISDDELLLDCKGEIAVLLG